MNRLLKGPTRGRDVIGLGAKDEDGSFVECFY
jgi:hypothetical protein